MKHLAICISGQYRSFDNCYESIIKTFVTSNPNYRVKIFICFSKETDKYITIPKEIYEHCGKIKIEEDSLRPDLTNQVNKFHSTDLILNRETGTFSSYYQLLQIKTSYELMLEYEKEQNMKFDYIARIRPDLSYESEFDWVINDDFITILDGSDWNGYNDKFAIGPRELMSKYMNRYDFWISNWYENISTHNETNLKLWLDVNNIKVNRTNLRYKYVRFNDTSKKTIQFLEISENKVVYENVSETELDVLVKVYDSDESLCGEIANNVFYSEHLKLPPKVPFFSICENRGENKKMFSIEGKDLYIEHVMK